MPRRPRKPVTTSANREPRVVVRPEALRYFRVTLMRADTEERMQGIPVNLNTAGMFIRTAVTFPEDIEILLEAHAHDERTEYRFRVRGWVAYCVPDGMGIQFDDPDPETAYLIRHLVKLFLPAEHHLADPSW
jgi:hypothetical protein